MKKKKITPLRWCARARRESDLVYYHRKLHGKEEKTNKRKHRLVLLSSRFVLPFSVVPGAERITLRERIPAYLAKLCDGTTTRCGDADKR